MTEKARSLIKLIDVGFQRVILLVCCVMVLSMVAFIIYTVVMRYVFLDPPFWADTVSLFANIWFVLLAYSLAVRNNDHIAMQAFYGVLSKRQMLCMDVLWCFITLLLGGFLVWYGWEAAARVPGQFWELGGFPKSYALAIMPISGALILLAALARLIEDFNILRVGAPYDVEQDTSTLAHPESPSEA